MIGNASIGNEAILLKKWCPWTTLLHFLICVKTLKDTHLETEGVYEIGRYQSNE